MEFPILESGYVLMATSRHLPLQINLFHSNLFHSIGNQCRQILYSPEVCRCNIATLQLHIPPLFHQENQIHQHQRVHDVVQQQVRRWRDGRVRCRGGRDYINQYRLNFVHGSSFAQAIDATAWRLLSVL